MQLEINNELKNLIPPLTEDEYQRLEKSILAEGCRDAIIVWNNIIIDGHNRYEICKKHGINFAIVEKAFIDIEAAKDWMDSNQLARRNLTPDQRQILIGRRYLREKLKHGGDRKSSGQIDHLKTSEKLAEEYKVAPKTVRRYAETAKQFEQLQKEKPELAKEIFQGKKTFAEAKKEERNLQKEKEVEEIRKKPASSMNGLYDVVVIDPPWPMQKIERECAPNQTKSLDYPTMTEDELKGFKLPMADDCHVWLWTTHKFLPMAFRLLDYWGLKYVCCFTWHKNGGFQPFGLPQYNSEFALYARKGTPTFIDTKAFNTCFQAPRGTHSEKPAEFYDIVRRVAGGSRIDIFSRRKIDGFDQYGNQI